MTTDEQQPAVVPEQPAQTEVAEPAPEPAPAEPEAAENGQAAVVEPRDCARCHKTFEPATAKQKYCSRACYLDEFKERAAAREAAPSTWPPEIEGLNDRLRELEDAAETADDPEQLAVLRREITSTAARLEAAKNAEMAATS
jgi:hypothetical protein